MIRFALVFAGLHGAVAVALGAYAAHGMGGAFDAAAVGWVETGTRYELAHAAALAAVAALLRGSGHGPGHRALVLAAWAFALGALLFAGSLYGLAFTGRSTFGAIAPFGGGAMILGWIALLVAGLGHRPPSAER